jgi:hypothetical protein
MREEQERARDEMIHSGLLDKSSIDLPMPVIPYVSGGRFIQLLLHT